MSINRDSIIDIEPTDVETALNIVDDIFGPSECSLQIRLAQWVATIRRFERNVCLAEEKEDRRKLG